MRSRPSHSALNERPATHTYCNRASGGSCSGGDVRVLGALGDEENNDTLLLLLLPACCVLRHAAPGRSQFCMPCNVAAGAFAGSAVEDPADDVCITQVGTCMDGGARCADGTNNGSKGGCGVSLAVSWSAPCAFAARRAGPSMPRRSGTTLG